MLALLYEEFLATRNLNHKVGLAIITSDHNLAVGGISIIDVDLARCLCHRCLTLRGASLKELLHTRQTLRNIGS